MPENEQWDEGLERDRAIDKPASRLEELVQAATEQIKKTKLSRRDAGIGAIGLIAGLLLERTFTITDVIIPSGNYELFTQVLQNNLKVEDEDGNIWLAEIGAKFGDVLDFTGDLLPDVQLLGDQALNSQVTDYSLAHMRDASLNQYQGLVKLVQKYRAKQGKQLAFEDLLIAYANIPYRANPTGQINYGISRTFDPASVAFQAVDSFMRTTGLAREVYFSNGYDSLQFNQSFSAALNSVYPLVMGKSPSAGIKEESVRFVTTALGKAAGIQ